MPPSAKRPRLKFESYQDFLGGDEDYSVLHHTEARFNSRSGLIPRGSSPQKLETDWTIEDSWYPDDPEFALDDEAGELYDKEIDQEGWKVERDGQKNKRKRKREKNPRSQTSRRVHKVWTSTYRTKYLDELLRHEGRGDFRAEEKCPDCVARKVPNDQCGSPILRCRECFLDDLVCSSCCVRRHKQNPLHVVESWNGTYFSKTSLKNIGLRVQLNHSSSRCPNAEPCNQALRVLHTNGIHNVAFDYCGCTRQLPHHVQLLRRSLYPSSQVSVKTCASFRLLEFLHILAVISKGSTYDYYHALEKLTNNTGIDVPKSRYRALGRMCLQWRHLKMLKRGGRGHDERGIEGTTVGELAIRCPSCPHPGINMVKGWVNAPPKFKYLYAPTICLDANFRLKNQLVSSYSRDPCLGTGWSYFVDRVPYEKYVLAHANEADISTCVGFQAIAQATTRFTRGLRYTGVGGASCGRSDMILPNGIGDLQKGERYCNMDMIFASAVKSFEGISNVIVSYDIACQWFVNLDKRTTGEWPEHLKLPPTLELTPGIPAFHYPAHGAKKHDEFDPRLIQGNGTSDNEGPERIWGAHNQLGNSTKSMGPESRHLILDDNFSHWNWLKYAGHGSMLRRRHRTGIADRNIQVEAHRGFTDGLPEELVQEWEEMCVAWEHAAFPKSKNAAINPYSTEQLYLSEREVHLELDKEELARVNGGGAVLHHTSAVQFIIAGLDIEDSQRKLATSIRNASKNRSAILASQQTTITEQRTVLREKLAPWVDLHPIYTPGLLQLLADISEPATAVADGNPEVYKLWLPSEIPEERRSAACAQGLAGIESRLRTAQCYDALDDVRYILRVKSRMLQFKNANIRGQRDGIRSRAVIDRVHDKAMAAVRRYRACRAGKAILDGPGEWEGSLKELKDEDIRSYQDPNRLKRGTGRSGTNEDMVGGEAVVQPRVEAAGDDNDSVLFNDDRGVRNGTGEKRKALSWIWTTTRSLNIDDGTDDDDRILRSEWCKSRARAARGVEEVNKVKEEMKRTLEYLRWRKEWWTNLVSERASLGKDMLEGFRAYALRQAQLQDSLRLSFESTWGRPLVETLSIPLFPDSKDPDGDDEDSDSSNSDESDESDDEDEDEDSGHGVGVDSAGK